MTKSAVVLGILHDLQGPRFSCYVDDPSYPLLLKEAMKGIDCVFEEASGHSPSIAEDLAATILGAGHYVDIDPSVDERPKYGLPKTTAFGVPVDMWNSADSYVSMLSDVQGKREELWVKRIAETSFSKAIVIVGVAHCLSVAFRLISAGIGVESVWGYTPHEKLCKRAHA
jgi:hypothetical protein